LDAYVAAIKDIDPMSTSLIFNCGMGVVRSKLTVLAFGVELMKQQHLQWSLLVYSDVNNYL
jgi:hypothetical protein